MNDEGNLKFVKEKISDALGRGFGKMKKKFPGDFEGFKDWKMRTAREFDCPFVVFFLG